MLLCRRSTLQLCSAAIWGADLRNLINLVPHFPPAHAGLDLAASGPPALELQLCTTMPGLTFPLILYPTILGFLVFVSAVLGFELGLSLAR
jgi:hypothetical protein